MNVAVRVARRDDVRLVYGAHKLLLAIDVVHVLSVIFGHLHVRRWSIEEHSFTSECILTNLALLLLINTFIEHFNELPCVTGLLKQDRRLVITTANIGVFTDEATCHNRLTFVLNLITVFWLGL